MTASFVLHYNPVIFNEFPLGLQKQKYSKYPNMTNYAYNAG